MFGNPFQLKSTLSVSSPADEDDTLNAKKAFGSLGYYKTTKHGLTRHPDNSLFEGIRRFQSAFGLKRDGIMKPGGETERTLGRVLEKKSASTTKPPSPFVATSAPERKSSLLDPFPPTTPGIMPGQRDPANQQTQNNAWPEPSSQRHPWGIRNLLELIMKKAQDSEVVSSAARTVKAALKTSDHTDLAKMHATAIKDFGDDALAEVEEFREQLFAANKLIHDSWLEAFRNEMPEDADRMMLAASNKENSLKGRAGNDTFNAEQQSGLDEEIVGTPPKKPEPPMSESSTNESGTSNRYESPVNQKFRNSLHGLESATDGDGYTSFNPEAGGIGALGRYQMRKDALIDTGMMDNKGNWTGRYGVKNAKDFLNNPEAQERAFADYMAKTEGYLEHNGSYNMIGQSFPGKLGEGITITESGLLAAAHRQGHGNVKEYLKHQQATGWKSDFSELLSDIRAKYESVETRLRLFQDIPYR